MAAPVISLDVNGGGSGTTFTATNVSLPMGGNGIELRWSDSVTTMTTKSYVEWPAFVRPASGTSPATTFALYYFSADTGIAGGGTGVGIPGGATPVVYTNANYMQLRWNIAAGTFAFASAPILTAYDDNTHVAPAARASTSSPAFPNNLSGSSTDTSGTAVRSYLKANAYGRFADVPAAAPANAPVVTDGAANATATTTATSWLTNYQGLMADVDFITCGATPAASTPANWNFILALFSGANMATGTYTSVVSLKYTFS